MNGLLMEYLPILLFIGIAGGLSLVLMLVPLRYRPVQARSGEALPAYECGFNRLCAMRA